MYKGVKKEIRRCVGDLQVLKMIWQQWIAEQWLDSQE
jgi:hypothetical protein